MPSRDTQRSGRKDRRARSILSPRDFVARLIHSSPTIADAAIIKTPPFAFEKKRPTGDGGLILDTQGCCRWASLALAQTLGVGVAGLIGDGWKRHLCENTMRRIQTTWAVSQLKFIYFPYVTLHAHNSAHRAFVRFRPIWSAIDGSLMGYLGLKRKLALAVSRPVERVG